MTDEQTIRKREKLRETKTARQRDRDRKKEGNRDRDKEGYRHRDRTKEGNIDRERKKEGYGGRECKLASTLERDIFYLVVRLPRPIWRRIVRMNILDKCVLCEEGPHLGFSSYSRGGGLK